MKVTEQKAEGLKKKYQVVIENKDFEAKVEKKLNEVAKNVKLPGFRPGKAPKEMLKQKYRASVMGEALDEMVRDAADEVVKENKLKLALRPSISITKFDEGKDIEFDMEAETLPEIKVGDFSDVKVEKLMAEVPAEEVEKALQYIVSSRRETVKVEDAGRQAKKGDTLVIDFCGSIDGVEFQGGKGSDYPLELGSNTFIPGFEDQLINAKAGDKIDVKVKFPDNYHAKDLAGKDAVFAVEVKEIREPKAIEVNDEFAKSVGEESLDALKESIKNRIKADYENASKLKLKRSLLDKLEELYKIYGYCLNTLHSYEFDGSAGFAKMQRIMQAFRGGIKEFGGKKVVKLLDYAPGLDGLPKSDVLKFLLEDNCSVVVRPSGTEPKIKVYILTKGVDAAERDANIEKYSAWVKTLTE